MLKGINVGGQKRVSMQSLKNMYSSLGLIEIETYVQSGNVLFSSDATESFLKNRIEKEIKREYGFEVPVFLRTEKELVDLIKNSPFKQKDETKLHVTFLSDRPSNSVPVEDLNAVKFGTEEFSITGREVYLFCPNGYGATKLSNNFFEKKLKVTATTRNWKTVNTLSSMLSSS